MEVITLLLLFVIIFITARSKSALEEKITILSKKVDNLKADLTKLSREAVTTTPRPETKTEVREEVKPVIKEEIKPILKPDISIYAKPATPEPAEGIKPVPVAASTDESIIKPQPILPAAEKPAMNVSLPSQRPAAQRPPVKPREPEKSFFEKYPDLEKFIGENLINKIGIAILVLGIGFFVKFAIDQDWINEIGRVAIGIVCGGILLGFAHKLRNEYKAFSSVLVGGGMAIFYFSITIAFHQYHIFSQTAAFIIMIFITGFTVLFSLSYNRIELAVLAIIGGFASPFMVSTGEGNYIVLFTYILVLNIGMIVLAFYKKWNIVNFISYVFTIILYGSWLMTKVKGNPAAPYIGALIFASIFYVVFFIMNVINNIKEKRKFIAADISILISNTFLYYSAGMFILKNIQGGMYQGLFTALIAVFNFIFAYTLYKSKKADSNVVYLLIGLVLTFVSLAAPVQLEGNYITLFWSLETVLLLWLSQKSDIKIIKAASILVSALMLISLIMDWNKIYGASEGLYIILNKAFVTSIVSVLSVTATIFLLKKENEIMFYTPDRDIYKNILLVALTILIYFSGLLELNFQLNLRVEPASLRTIIIGSYNMLCILILVLLSGRFKTSEMRIAGLTAGVLGVFIFIIYYNLEITKLREDYINNLTTFPGFLYHYITTGLALVILTISLKATSKEYGFKDLTGKIFLWYFMFALIVTASIEMDHIVLISAYSPGDSEKYILTQNHKIGFPILWGVFSFILMFIGMNRKIKDLRIIALTIFTITLLKLFLVDVREMSEGGKIAAFICLGILLLIISFMYQKLKKLVSDDEPKNSAPVEVKQ